jgi:hypothetical protein
MQVVSAPIGRQQVHFQAPPAERLEAETGRFLDWLNGPSKEPPLIKAGLGQTLAAGIQRGATEEGIGGLTPAAYAQQLK